MRSYFLTLSRRQRRKNPQREFSLFAGPSTNSTSTPRPASRRDSTCSLTKIPRAGRRGGEGYMFVRTSTLRGAPASRMRFSSWVATIIDMGSPDDIAAARHVRDESGTGVRCGLQLRSRQAARAGQADPPAGRPPPPPPGARRGHPVTLRHGDVSQRQGEASEQPDSERVVEEIVQRGVHHECEERSQASQRQALQKRALHLSVSQQIVLCRQIKDGAVEQQPPRAEGQPDFEKVIVRLVSADNVGGNLAAERLFAHLGSVARGKLRESAMADAD